MLAVFKNKTKFYNCAFLLFLNYLENRSTDKKKRATRFDKQDLCLRLVLQNTDLFRNCNFVPIFR